MKKHLSFQQVRKILTNVLCFIILIVLFNCGCNLINQPDTLLNVLGCLLNALVGGAFGYQMYLTFNYIKLFINKSKN